MNIVTAKYFGIPFGYYATVMVPVDLVSIATALLVLWLHFWRDLEVEYRVEDLEAPQGVVKDPAVFRAAFPLLGLLRVAYFVTGPLAVPIALVTGAAAIALLVVAGRWTVGRRGAIIPLSKVMRDAP